MSSAPPISSVLGGDTLSSTRPSGGAEALQQVLEPLMTKGLGSHPRGQVATVSAPWERAGS